MTVPSSVNFIALERRFQDDLFQTKRIDKKTGQARRDIGFQQQSLSRRTLPDHENAGVDKR